MSGAGRAPWLLVLLVFWTAGWATASGLPESRVVDEAGLFDRKPEQREALAERLERLGRELDLPVYLVIYGGLIGERIDQRSRQLHDAWIGREHDGLVVVWDSDTGEMAFGLPQATYSDAVGLEEARRTRLPDRRVRPVLDAVAAEVAGIEDKEAFAGRLATELEAGLRAMLAEPPVRQGGRLGGVVLGTVVLGGVLAVLGLWSGRFIRRPEEPKRPHCFFPDVLVGGRLGASCGGGRVAVVDYNREEPEEEE